MEVFAYAPWGYEGDLVHVEVDVRRGLPAMDIVGLPGGAVREARDRIRIALRRSGFEFPSERILFNLSPADLPKHGSGFDLPMALALLAATGQWNPPYQRILAMGELSLDGRLKRSPGGLAAVQSAWEMNLDAIYLPKEAAEEVAGDGPCPCLVSDHLIPLVKGEAERARPWQPPPKDETGVLENWPLRGRGDLTLPLEVCAAGGHSLLLYGPPGSGKTLAARSFQSLLPPLSSTASKEVSRIWSLAGRLPRGKGLLQEQPFLEPHHSSSIEGLLGGGRNVGPGEVSLAHQGVLFLDEAPEFSSRVLQSLREPLETGSLLLARAGRSAWYPSRFQLLLTANACPCGQTGREQGLCSCSGQEIRRYWDRIGTALMDRVDVRCFLQPPNAAELLDPLARAKLPSKARIFTAWSRQIQRKQNTDRCNASLEVSLLSRYCKISAGAQKRVSDCANRLGWSARAAHSIIRIARTLADLDDREELKDDDMELALSLRQPKTQAFWES